MSPSPKNYPPADKLILDTGYWTPADNASGSPKSELFIDGLMTNAVPTADKVMGILTIAANFLHAPLPVKTNAGGASHKHSCTITVDDSVLNQARRNLSNLRTKSPYKRGLRPPYVENIILRDGSHDLWSDEKGQRRVNLAELIADPDKRARTKIELMRVLSGVAHVRNEGGTNTDPPKQNGDIITVDPALLEDARERMKNDRGR